MSPRRASTCTFTCYFFFFLKGLCDIIVAQMLPHLRRPPSPSAERRAHFIDAALTYATPVCHLGVGVTRRPFVSTGQLPGVKKRKQVRRKSDRVDRNRSMFCFLGKIANQLSCRDSRDLSMASEIRKVRIMNQSRIMTGLASSSFSFFLEMLCTFFSTYCKPYI